MAKGFSLKDQLFNRDKLAYLASLFQARDLTFPAEDFVDQVMQDLPSLELKQRIALISKTLDDYLPSDFSKAVATIREALPPPLDPDKSDDDFGDFIFAPLGEFVARKGLSDAHVPLALEALEDLTQRFSVEFDIRAFLNEYPDETLTRLAIWAEHPHYHVRRLVSEGTRPKLPWGRKITIPIEAAIPLLDRLHADQTRYVTRSVANHLNDIAKIDPELVLQTLARWHGWGRQEARELDWMTRHALRGLVKKGHPPALEFLGFKPDPEVRIVVWSADDPTCHLGEQTGIHLTLEAEEDVALIVDYIVDMPRPNGTISSKVFKLKRLHLATGEKISLRKAHRFVKDASTITYHPGPHHLHLQINGARLASQCIQLLP